MDPQEALRAKVERAFADPQRRGTSDATGGAMGDKPSRHSKDRAFVSSLVKRSKEQADNKPDAASAWQVFVSTFPMRHQRL